MPPWGVGGKPPRRFVRAVQAIAAKPHLVACKRCFGIIEFAWLERHYDWHDENDRGE